MVSVTEILTQKLCTISQKTSAGAGMFSSRPRKYRYPGALHRWI